MSGPAHSTGGIPSDACPVCASDQLEPFLSLDAVPVLSTRFHDDREAARAAPRGDLLLAVCPTCAMVYNTAFDPDVVDYTPDYENSQHFSPAFRDYVDQLADRLDASVGLEGGTVVDIGCGKGEFLALIADAAGARGVGFDPTFRGDVDHERVDVVRDYYDRSTARAVDADLVMARHVVEHLPDPVSFLTEVREASGRGVAHYYEVPNAEHVFSDHGMWDLIYQHVGYFGRPSLDRALRASGHRVVRLESSFHDQFLGIDAVAGDDVSADAPSAADVEALVDQIETFGVRHRARLDRWNDELAATDRNTVLWGAGAKGVAFLNSLADPGAVNHVVDINPRKAGRFVPGTGHDVREPSTLDGSGVELVIVMNPAYVEEITSELAHLGVRADVLVAETMPRRASSVVATTPDTP